MLYDTYNCITPVALGVNQVTCHARPCVNFSLITCQAVKQTPHAFTLECGYKKNTINLQ